MAQAPRLSVPIIPLAERTPTVELLLAIIEHQHATIAALEQRVSALDAEVRRLKHLPPRPNIKPSALDKSRDDDEPPPSRGGASARKRPGSNKRRKRVTVHRCVIITPETLPPGSWSCSGLVDSWFKPLVRPAQTVRGYDSPRWNGAAFDYKTLR